MPDQLTPADHDRMRHLAAQAPGFAIYPENRRAPRRLLELTTPPAPADTWRPARPDDTPGQLIPETGPQQPLHLADPAPLEIPPGDPGADLAALIRRAWTRWTRDRKPRE